MARLAALCLGLLFLAGGARAEGLEHEKHGAWETRCETPPGAERRQCYLVETAMADDRPNVVLIIIALSTADRKSRLLRVIAPLGVLLPQGMQMRFGDQAVGTANFIRCLPNGCIAEAEINDRLLATIEAAKTAVFTIYETPEEPIPVLVPVDGFKEAMDSLP